MRIFVIGDTHGNYAWLKSYIFPQAKRLLADAIVQVGDFGAWEHTGPGVRFFNAVDQLCAEVGIPLYWLHGNHDKFSHTLLNYGRQRDRQGFVVCRENLFYIPQGHTWTWDGVSFRAFGGAYSIDKSWRIQEEQSRYRILQREAHRKVGAGNLFSSTVVPSQTGTLWFPEEEMTDAEMDELLAEDSSTKDVILSHDKPLSAKPDWGKPEIPGCIPNQIRLERALRVHRPAWWLHGHLHYGYSHRIHGDGWTTTVVGLDTDEAAGEQTWSREKTWRLLDLSNGALAVVSRREFDA